MLKPVKYMVKKELPQRFSSGLRESLCQIKPEFLGHYIFKNIEKKSFLISKEYYWEIHPNKLKNRKIKLKTLSENEFGP